MGEGGIDDCGNAQNCVAGVSEGDSADDAIAEMGRADDGAMASESCSEA